VFPLAACHARTVSSFCKTLLTADLVSKTVIVIPKQFLYLLQNPLRADVLAFGRIKKTSTADHGMFSMPNSL